MVKKYLSISIMLLIALSFSLPLLARSAKTTLCTECDTWFFSANDDHVCHTCLFKKLIKNIKDDPAFSDKNLTPELKKLWQQMQAQYHEIDRIENGGLNLSWR
jgi:hypothetical protein